MKKRQQKNTEKAVAIKYDRELDVSPKVVAKGEGFVASKIKEEAMRFGVPIYRDDDLVNLLAQVEIDREIPSDLYASIAEILSWIYKANNEIKRGTF